MGRTCLQKKKSRKRWRSKNTTLSGWAKARARRVAPEKNAIAQIQATPHAKQRAKNAKRNQMERRCQMFGMKTQTKIARTLDVRSLLTNQSRVVAFATITEIPQRAQRINVVWLRWR